MKPVQYILLNKGLGMSTGKSAAQAAHASVNGYLLTPDSNLKRVWWRGGHHTKIVLECRDSDHLRDSIHYLTERGVKVALVIDEGHTEVPPLTPTAIGTEIVDKDDAHIAATFSSFDLYKDTPQEVVILEHTGAIPRDVLDSAKRAVAEGDLDKAKAIIRYGCPPEPPQGLLRIFGRNGNHKHP